MQVVEGNGEIFGSLRDNIHMAITDKADLSRITLLPYLEKADFPAVYAYA